MTARSFDVQFTLKWYEALSPRFEIVRELTPEESEEWMQRAEKYREEKSYE